MVMAKSTMTICMPAVVQATSPLGFMPELSRVLPVNTYEGGLSIM